MTSFYVSFSITFSVLAVLIRRIEWCQISTQAFKIYTRKTQVTEDVGSEMVRNLLVLESFTSESQVLNLIGRSIFPWFS